MSDIKSKANIGEIIDYVFTLVDADEPKVAISDKSLDLTHAILAEKGGVHAFLDNHYIAGIKKMFADFDSESAEIEQAVIFFFEHKAILLELLNNYSNKTYKGNVKKMMQRIMPLEKYSSKNAIEAMTCLVGKQDERDTAESLSEPRRSLIIGLVFFVYDYISQGVGMKRISKEIESKPVELFGVMHTREEFEKIRVMFAS